MRAVCYKKHNTRTSQYLLVSLVLLVLVLPLGLQESIAAPSPHRAAMEVGFAPSAGSWSYFTGTNRSEPPAEQYAMLRIGPGACRSITEVDHFIWPKTRRVCSSVSYRQQYLVPVFNSTYT